MRKRYIFWWVISAIFFWFFVASLLYGEGASGANGIALFIFGVTFYVGYLRHKEYEQQQEDRNALHRFVEYSVGHAEKTVVDPVVETHAKSEIDLSVSSQISHVVAKNTFEDCVNYVIKQESVSVSMLQRTMRVGYSQAGRWMDEMYSLGIVGPYRSQEPRQVLFTSDNFPGINELRQRRLEQKKDAAPQIATAKTWTLWVDVVGETFKNEDGTARQRILKQAYDEECAGHASLEQYIYQGTPAVRVLYDNKIVGNIGRNDVNKVLACWERIQSGDLTVDRFIPEDLEFREENPQRSYVGKYIYYAHISLIIADASGSR